MGRRFLELLRATQDRLGTALASGPGHEPDDHHYGYQRGTVLVPAHAVPSALVTLNGTPRGDPWARPDGEEVRAGLRRISMGDRRAYAAGGLHPGVRRAGTFIAELLAGVAPGARVWVSNLSVYAPGERLVAGFLDAPLKYQHSTFAVCQFLRHSPPDCDNHTGRRPAV